MAEEKVARSFTEEDLPQAFLYWHNGRNNVAIENIKEDIAEIKADMRSMDEKFTAEFANVRAEIGGLRAEMKTEIGGLRAEMRTEIGSLRTEMRTEIGSLRTEMNTNIDSLRTEIGSLRTEMNAEIGSLRTEMNTNIDSLRTEIGSLRTEMNAEIGSLRTDFGDLRKELNETLWKFLVGVGIIIAIVEYVFKHL